MHIKSSISDSTLEHQKELNLKRLLKKKKEKIWEISMAFRNRLWVKCIIIFIGY